MVSVYVFQSSLDSFIPWIFFPFQPDNPPGGDVFSGLNLESNVKWTKCIRMSSIPRQPVFSWVSMLTSTTGNFLRRPVIFAEDYLFSQRTKMPNFRRTNLYIPVLASFFVPCSSSIVTPSFYESPSIFRPTTRTKVSQTVREIVVKLTLCSGHSLWSQ